MADNPILKGLTAYIKAKSSAEQAQQKFATALQLDKIKDDRNFMQNIEEKNQMNPFQRIMMEQYQKEQGGGSQPGVAGGMGGQGTTDVQAGAGGQAPDPYALPTEEERYDTSMVMTPTGPKQTRKKVGIREIIYRRIKKMPEDERSARDTEFLNEYLGVGESERETRKEKIAKSEVLAILKKGSWFSEDQGGPVPFTDRDEALSYVMDNYDIDVTDPEVQELLSNYKEAEEKITPAKKASWFKPKTRATKQKYGYTYEQQDDGTWKKQGSEELKNIKAQPQRHLATTIDKKGNPIKRNR